MIEVEFDNKVYLHKYRPLAKSTADINFLYGGRDSGKSHFIAQRLIRKCLDAPYFRCLLIKKTFNSIKESQWQTIKDIVDQWGMHELFNFTVSPLAISCINGNKFIARGCDDPQSIKSVKDPSDAWYEEGNQLTMDDFITVTTTLRTNRAKIQQWFSFNPECDGDYEDFWLYKTFFKDKGIGEHEWKLSIGNEEVTYRYTITHSTYHDNKYCRPERKVFLEQLKEIDPYYYDVYTLGLWGKRQNGSPFAYAYDQKIHLNSTVWNSRDLTYLSFDFNRDPITCMVAQHGPDWINIIEQIKLPNSNIYNLCDYILSKYPRAEFMVTGDATGRATSALVQDNLNYYTVIKSKLGLSNGQLKLPPVNPPIRENRVLVNAVLHNIKVSIDPVNAKGLVFDLEHASVLPDGSLDKTDRADPTKQNDALDCFRYYCNTFFRHILKN